MIPFLPSVFSGQAHHALAILMRIAICLLGILVGSSIGWESFRGNTLRQIEGAERALASYDSYTSPMGYWREIDYSRHDLSYGNVEIYFAKALMHFETPPFEYKGDFDYLAQIWLKRHQLSQQGWTIYDTKARNVTVLLGGIGGFFLGYVAVLILSLTTSIISKYLRIILNAVYALMGRLWKAFLDRVSEVGKAFRGQNQI